jgi:hypothetical protein
MKTLTRMYADSVMQKFAGCYHPAHCWHKSWQIAPDEAEYCAIIADDDGEEHLVLPEQIRKGVVAGAEHLGITEHRIMSDVNEYHIDTIVQFALYGCIKYKQVNEHMMYLMCGVDDVFEAVTEMRNSIGNVSLLMKGTKFRRHSLKKRAERLCEELGIVGYNLYDVMDGGVDD